MKKQFIIHPFLFAVFPILFFFSNNKDELLPSNRDLLSALLVSLLVALILWALLSWILRSVEKAGMLTSLFFFLFFSYGHLHSLIENVGFSVGKISVGPNKILFLVFGVLSLLTFYLLAKTKKNLSRTTTFLNVVTFSLVAISLVNIVTYEFGSGGLLPTGGEGGEGEASSQGVVNPAGLPDVYYFIFDSYANSETLREIYHYDDHQFTSFLEEKGFYVVTKSRSNYAHSFLSVASSLNMNYLDEIFPHKTVIRQRDTAPLIEDSKVSRFLKRLGYKFIHIGSGWGPTTKNRNADVNFNFKEGQSLKLGEHSLEINEFSMVLLKTTMLYPLIKDNVVDDVRALRLYGLNKATEVASLEGPKFVFAHLTASHPPYLFDADGKPILKSKLEMSGDVFKNKKDYLNQLIFVSKKIEVMVEEMLKKSKTPPIIVFQADHGPASILGHPKKWGPPSKGNMRGIEERMSVLNVYHLPNGGSDLLYDSITPVNTFRLIFDFYFEGDYDLLPDKSYYSASADKGFFDVTGKID